jgi:hypothetical protein
MADEPVRMPPDGQVLIYQDGGLEVQVRLDGETVWPTQAAMAELYQTTPRNITIHLESIFGEGELDEPATCKEYLQVRPEGSRRVQRNFDPVINPQHGSPVLEPPVSQSAIKNPQGSYSDKPTRFCPDSTIRLTYLAYGQARPISV